jgi:uncharacterized protein YjiS (DUF1127 family)
MAYLPSCRDNIVRLAAHSRRPTRLQIVHRAYDNVAPLLRLLQKPAARWRQRRVLARLVTAQCARQRRVLARLSPRELTEIGLTRHDVEIGLR